MNFCRFCRARLSEFLDGQLSASEREQVAAHLETCADCAHARDELQNDQNLARAALGELAPLHAPADLQAKVRAALQNEAVTRAKPIFAFDLRRWNTAKFVWAGTLTCSALALMIMARPAPQTPLSQAPLSQAPLSDSAPLPSRENQAAPAAAPRPRVTARTPALSAPRPKIPAFKAPKVIVVRPLTPPTTTTAPPVASPRRAPESKSTPLPTSAPRAVTVPRQTRPAPLTKQPRQGFQAPSFPALSGQKTSPDVAPPSPPRTTARRSASPPLPNIVAPPQARTRFRSAAAPPETAAPEAAPHFEVTLAAAPPNHAARQLSRAENGAPKSQSPRLDTERDDARLRAKSTSPADQKPPAVAPSRGEEEQPRALAENFAADSAAPRRAAPDAASPPGPSSLENRAPLALVSPPARSFQLNVTAPRAYAGAQIRLILAAPLRFSVTDASASRTLWRGDFAANAPVLLSFSLQGVRGGEKISLVVEQNGGVGESKILETQTLTLPPPN